tara:strand:+ start:9813 stop:9938 length:126 start_codon:yes stop_codon:yes gene_type:complete
VIHQNGGACSRHDAKKATLRRLTEIRRVLMLRLEFYAGYGV